MLGVLLAPTMQQARRELVFATNLGGMFLTRRDPLTDLELELVAERPPWRHPAAVCCRPGEDRWTNCPVMGIHHNSASAS
jgi:hypothetical protein